jgi:hypothetical protein
MSLSRHKAAVYESPDEAQFYAPFTLPPMHRDTAAIAPLILEVPLFAIVRKKTADAVLPMVNAVWYKSSRSGFLRYEGPQLTQSHLTVLLTLVNRRAGNVVSNIFEFRPSALLAAMGWSDNPRNVTRLSDMLDDLKRGQVRIWKDGQVESRDALRVSFVDTFKPSSDDNWRVNLSTDLMPLFADSPTRIDLPTRAALTEGLATFLYGYIAGNNGALAVKYRDLHSMCGSGTKDMGDFADSTRNALERLKVAGVITGYTLKHGGFKFTK